MIELRKPGRHRGVMIMACIMLYMALPSVLVESRAGPAPPVAPPALDRFLARVRTIVPPTARVLIAGNPSPLVFYRAIYQLYPRTVYTAVPTDSTSAFVRWRDLNQLAHRRGARYVLVWALPLAVRGKVQLRAAAGTLVDLCP